MYIMSSVGIANGPQRPHNPQKSTMLAQALRVDLTKLTNCCKVSDS